jgi:hypothetical protein
MSSKRFFLSLIFTIALLFGGALVVSYILDPFQVYHTSLYSKSHYLSNDRYQNAGLINRFLDDGKCCEIAILGTSHSQNFIPGHVSKVFYAKGVLDLTMLGARSTEQITLFDRIKVASSLQTVIWGIHTTYSKDKLYEVNEKNFVARAPDKYFPEFLYDTNILNDIKYVASIDAFINAYKLLVNGKEYETLKSWYSENIPSFNQGKRLADLSPDLTRKSIPNFHEVAIFPNISEVLFPLVEDNKQIKFMFFFPPYSKHFYANMSQEEFSVLMNMRNYTVRQLSSFENVEIYALDNVLDSTNYLDNYKDLAHYNEETSKRIIEFMAKNKGNLRAANVQEDIRRLIENVNVYIENYEENDVNKR